MLSAPPLLPRGVCRRARTSILLLALALSGCGGGGGGADPNALALIAALNGGGSAPATPGAPPAAVPPVQPGTPLPQAVRVEVRGLRGSGLVLQNNGADDLAIAADGTRAFAARIPVGGAYQVSIKTLPQQPPQTCKVTGGAGQVAADDSPMVSISCNKAPHFAFVTSLSQTSVFGIDDTTGDLSPTGFSVSYGGLLASTIAPSGRFLYRSDLAAKAVRGFSIDIDSGELRELAGSPAATGQVDPYAMAMAPSGNFLYVADRANNRIDIFAVDTATGALTLTPATAATGGTPMAMTITPDGRLLYVANDTAGSISIYALDRATGAATLVNETRFGPRARFMAVDAGGRFLYVTGGSDSSIYAFTIDGSNGTLSAVPGSPFVAGSNAQNLAIDPRGIALYVTNEGDDTVSAFAIHATTGSLTPLGSVLPAGHLPEGLAVDPVSASVYVAQQANSAIGIYAADAQSGSLTGSRTTAIANLPLGIAILGFP